MKYRYIIPLAFIILIIQTTIISEIRIANTHPSLIIVAIVTMIFVSDKKEGIILAIYLGLLQDVFYSKAIGINTLIYFLIALAIYFYKDMFSSDYKTNAVVVTALSTMIFYGLYYLISVLVLDNTRTVIYVFMASISEALFNSVIVYLLYGIVFKYIKGYEAR